MTEPGEQGARQEREHLVATAGDLGARLFAATGDLLSAGHAGALLVSSDNPTLPLSILRDAVRDLVELRR